MLLISGVPVSTQMMGDISFLVTLTNFPREQINDETVELLRPYFAAPDFNYNAAKKVQRIVMFRTCLHSQKRLNRVSGHVMLSYICCRRAYMFWHVANLTLHRCNNSHCKYTVGATPMNLATLRSSSEHCHRRAAT